MSTEFNEKVVKMGIDLFKGQNFGSYSKGEVEENFREAMHELMGNHKNVKRAFRANGAEIFTVLEDVMDILITEGLEDQFADFVEYRNCNFGDSPVFMQDDYHLFPVATIAAGTNDIRRQRLDRSGIRVPTAYKAVKFYEEWERFLAGKIDWVRMINKAQRSMNNQVAADINNALVAAYGGLSGVYSYSGTWDLTQFNNLIMHVEAATERKAFVAGTRLALQKAVPSYVAYNGQVIEDRNNVGYFKVVDGTTFVELKQAHIPGTDTFALNNNNLLVLPDGEERIVKVVLEGESEIIDSNLNGGNNTNSDDSVELLIRKKYGVAVATSTRYGNYALS